MPLYFFHILELTGLVCDREGFDLPDLDAARDEAVEGARQLISSAVLSGSPTRDAPSRRRWRQAAYNYVSRSH
jgi:hypothetical protein